MKQVLLVMKTSRRSVTTYRTVLKHPIFIQNVISIPEEQTLMKHLNKHLTRRKYEGNHWDDVIQKYREIELRNSTPEIDAIFRRVQEVITNEIRVFSDDTDLKFDYLNPHVIDLASDGHIGPHVDSLKFSGGIVASLSLLSTRILRLKKTVIEDGSAEPEELRTLLSEYEFLAPPRSLYILTGPFRYNYTHEILGVDSKGSSTILDPDSEGTGPAIEPSRRVSLIIRDVLATDVSAAETRSEASRY